MPVHLGAAGSIEDGAHKGVNDLDKWQQILLVVVIAVGSATIVYKLMPFRRWRDPKPSFVLFPKYVCRYERTDEDLIQALEELGFRQSHDGSTTFARGHAFGDFSARWMKLKIEVDPDAREFRVFAPAVGILFDTGDLWEIARELRSR